MILYFKCKVKYANNTISYNVDEISSDLVPPVQTYGYPANLRNDWKWAMKEDPYPNDSLKSQVAYEYFHRTCCENGFVARNLYFMVDTDAETIQTLIKIE